MNTYQSMPRSYSFTPANISLTGFASAVTGASWPLTATTSGDSLAHRVTVQNNSGNSKAGINIVIVGTDANGTAQTETLAGPAGSATVTSTKYFLTLTSVTPASTWGADTANIGWAGQFVSAWINVNWFAEDILSLIVDVSGTINFALNETFDDYTQSGITARWFALATAQTADGIWQTIGGATAVQFIANSYSNGATVVLNANATKVPNAPDAAGGSGQAVYVNGGSVGLLPGTSRVGYVGITDTTNGPAAVKAASTAPVATDPSLVVAISPNGQLAAGQATSANSVPVVLASDYFPAGYTYSRKTADGQVKGSAGVVHSITISATGTVTAGVLTIYDSLTETGTVLFSVSLPVTTFATIVLPLDAVFGTGLFVGFDATLANVQVLVSYR